MPVHFGLSHFIEQKKGLESNKPYSVWRLRAQNVRGYLRWPFDASRMWTSVVGLGCYLVTFVHTAALWEGRIGVHRWGWSLVVVWLVYTFCFVWDTFVPTKQERLETQEED